MNQKELDSTWLQYIEGRELDPATLNKLEVELKTNSQLVSDVADERIVNALLQLAGQTETQQEAFVMECVGRMQRAAANQSTGVDSPTEGLSGDCPNEEFAPQRFPESEIPVLINPVMKGSVLRGPTRQAGRSRKPRWIVAATCAASALLLLAATIWFLLAQPRSETGTTAGGKVIEVDEREFMAHDPTTSSANSTREPIETDSNQSPFDSIATHHTPEQLVAPVEPSPPTIADVAPRYEAPVINDQPDRDLPTSESPVAPRVTFAQIVNNGELDWADNKPMNRVGTKDRITIQSGRGVIKFDNGSRIFFEAPLDVILLDEGLMDLRAGKLLAELPSNRQPFEIVTGSNRLLAERRAEFQVRVGREGKVEAFLSKGRATVKSKGPGSEFGEIVLTPAGLNQVVTSSIQDDTIPTVLMATGHKKFLGQIGIGGRNWQTESPQEMVGMTNLLFEKQSEFSDENFQIRWRSFVDQVQAIDRHQPGEAMASFQSIAAELFRDTGSAENLHNQRDESENETTAFQGSINIDGQLQVFDSAEEYERVRQPLMRAGKIPFENRMTELPANNNNQMIPAVLGNKGPNLDFTSPDQFRQFRRENRQ